MTVQPAVISSPVKYFRAYGFTTYNWTTYYQPPSPNTLSAPLFTTWSAAPDANDVRAIACTVQASVNGQVTVSYGTRSGAYSGRTKPVAVVAGTPVTIRVTELPKGTYYLNAQLNATLPTLPGGVPTTNSYQSGEVSVSLTGTAPGPGISGASASPGGAGTGTCIITWTTALPASSVVNYGPTSTYGQTSSNPALVTSHSVNLSGLSHPATYHYQVSSTTSIGGSASSTDATFATT